MKSLEQDRITFRSIKDLIGDSIEATDGEIGACDDFLIDDKSWIIRYLVASTRKWLPGRKVLIAPHQFAVQRLGNDAQPFRIALSKQRIKEAPPLDNDSPVSREHQIELARHYQYQPYWTGSTPWVGAMSPMAVGDGPPLAPEESERHAKELRRIEANPLRSAHELLGYRILALDGELGTLADFLVETQSWTVRWMVIDTGGWLSSRRVIVSPDWVKGVSWDARQVELDVPIGQIERAPEFDDRLPVNRDYEGRLYDFYGRPRYWR